MKEPNSKRAIAYVDGQNLFHSAKEAFGYPFPNYNIRRLAETICRQNNWDLTVVHFYTGIPDPDIDPNRHHFWVAKLAVMGTRNIRTFSRPIRYSNQLVTLPDGSKTTTLVGREKGIDVRLALDVVRDALDDRYDVAVVFSQDQDLTEVADELRKISMRDDRWIKIACAFPLSPTSHNRRGINGTDWITINRAIYGTCIDPNDYRRKKSLKHSKDTK
jgi:uncharacterized LabA/DUF88 family protein